MKRLFLFLISGLTYFSVQSQKPSNKYLENLLTQGKIEKAITYSEKQEGPKQSDCFFILAEYYLNKKDYSIAEEYFNKSGKGEAGNVKIAEFLMKGELIDSVFVIDIPKVKTYLGKVYDDDKDILSKMAVCFEENAKSAKKQLAVLKAMKDIGIIGYSDAQWGGKTIDINKAFKFSKTGTELYFEKAIQFYQELNNVDKVEELKKEMAALDTETSDP